jgi:hypothetical protein
MAETLEKLRPDRDLQCFFFRPSAIAALSSVSDSGFTVSGTWRQQFDWAVIEWNRDNVYEHPAFRYLPDGDLSGLTLTYEETRTNCIPLDSDLYPTVDWPYLRVWAGDNGAEQIYYVPLRSHATPIEGAYQCAYADFTLSGTVTGGDYAGLAIFSEHYTYQMYGSDTLDSTAQALVDSINAFSTVLKATRTGATIRVYYTGGTSIEESTAGANGNRWAVYSYTSGSGSVAWDASWRTLANGTSPTKWRIALNFGSLMDREGRTVPTSKVRKMRWTYAADLQPGAYVRSEFQAVVSNWSVMGTGRSYSVAGPRSRRIEDNDPQLNYSGAWTIARGNYSGGSIHRTTAQGASVNLQYAASGAHTLYVGTRYTGQGASVAIAVDGQNVATVNLLTAGEDVLIRWPVGQYGAGPHTVSATHVGPDSNELFFDFFELAVLETALPVKPADARTTLATDWDTDHSLALAPERTAWMIDTLGFRGRQNHYAGALWFYELVRTGHAYASGSVTFAGAADPNYFVTVTIGRADNPSANTVLQKLIHVGDTPATLAAAFAIELNRGYTGLRASASGGTVTIYSRSMGADGNQFTLAASTTSANLMVTASGSGFTGGVDGDWRTDLTAAPRLNRAARDWSLSFFAALKSRGIDGCAAFSMELQHADPSSAAGIAQRGPAGDPILLPTPAVQTNFAPASLDFWQQVYAEMAAIQVAAGMQPYLQFGEVQWWYFPNDGLGHSFSGMPFYDAWTTAEFQSRYGRPLPVFSDNTADPEQFAVEVAFLSGLIGAFTNAVIAHVRGSYPTARFEALYPTDVNRTAFNQAINYPAGEWTPAVLTCLKTEGFGDTLARNLDQAEVTVRFGTALGFPASQRSHLVGIGDHTNAWLKEARSAQGKRFESVVLFALDQFCLIGYEDPAPVGLRRAVQFGG